MHLERLDRPHSATMVRQLLERKRLPAKLVEEIIVRTDGVPLFIEELTRTLATSPRARRRVAGTDAGRSEIPTTLQDSLMARLDQLGPAKEVAQMGAVIGREFGSDLLAAISTLDAHALRDVSLQRVDNRGPSGGAGGLRHHQSRDSLSGGQPASGGAGAAPGARPHRREQGVTRRTASTGFSATHRATQAEL